MLEKKNEMMVLFIDQRKLRKLEPANELHWKLNSAAAA